MKKILFIILIFISTSTLGQPISRSILRATQYLATDTIKSISGNGINVWNNKIKLVADPTDPQDAVNLRSLIPYVKKSDSLSVFVTPKQLSDSLATVDVSINDSLYVHRALGETMTGRKTFTEAIKLYGDAVTVASKNKHQVLATDSTGVGIIRLQTHYWNGSSFPATNGYGFGSSALQNNTGTGSNGFGSSALYNNTGTSSNGFGNYTLLYNQSSNNTALGNGAWNGFYDNTSGNKTFDYTAIDASTDRITIPLHGFGATGTWINVRYTQGTSSVTGLSTSSIYQIKIIDANTVSSRELISGVIYHGTDISSAGTGTGHIFTPQYTYTNTTVLGANSQPSADNQVVLGDVNVTEVKTTGSINMGSVLKMTPLADPPTSPSLGWIYVDTDTHIYMYNGTTWKQLDN